MAPVLRKMGFMPLVRPEHIVIPSQEFQRGLQEMIQKQQLASFRDLKRPVTFADVKTANRIRGPQRETTRLAGGLLGPYTSRDCTSSQVFIAKHVALLQQPSLAPQDIDDNALVLSLSYRHKDFRDRCFDKDRMTDLEYHNWYTVTRAIANSHDQVYFWQDQKAKGVQTDSDIDWIANGILPYIMCPVVRLTSVHGRQSDWQRLWICVEETLALASNGGYLLAERGAIWDSTMGSIMDVAEAERRFAAMVVHGEFEGKQTYHENDRLKMIRWAIAHLVSLSPESFQTFGDLRREASVSSEEMVTLCGQVMGHTKMSEGLTLLIKKRIGRSHTSWADLLPVFETQHSNVPGAVSVRGSDSTKGFDGEYNFVVREGHLICITCALNVVMAQLLP